LKIKEEKTAMDKKFVPEKYGIVICPLCSGKGFLIKDSDQINVTLRRACTKCGGFGAIKNEEETFGSLENENLIEKRKMI
jgi:DnaJ-class molecular chaperone